MIINARKHTTYMYVCTKCYALLLYIRATHYKKMQLDVDVSPPANIMTFWLTLTNVTFDPDLCDP